LHALQLVATFTNSNTKLEARKGGLFSLLDGLISGQYMELVSLIPPSLTELDNPSLAGKAAQDSEELERKIVA
jgi:hypothetical protein